MICKITETVEKYNMFPEGSKVVAAVSGGSDSMAMLYALLKIREQFGFSLSVAHVNHGLRGESADADELFVESFCKEHSIPCKILRADVAAFAKENGIGLEEAGRKVRYRFFASFGDDAVIATAHNADDRAETFLFNFARGSSLRGLCSIPAVRGNIVRPLIGCSKKEILEYCSLNGIDYVTDESNSDIVYSRNRLRHKVIPELEQINSSFVDSSGRCIEALREDEAFLSSLAAKAVEDAECAEGYSAAFLSNLPIPVKRRAVTAILEKEKSVTPEYNSILRICTLLEKGGSVQINSGLIVRVRKGVLDFPCGAQESFSVLCTGEGDYDCGGKKVECRIFSANENNLQFVSKELYSCYIDSDKISGEIVLRSREGGDKITLKNRGCTKTLKKLLNELEIPPEKRNSVVVVSDSNGVLAAEGIGADARACVTKETRNIMVFNFLKEGCGQND